MTDKLKRTYGFTVTEEKFADCPSAVVRMLVRDPGASINSDWDHPINPRSDGEDTLWDATKKTRDLALHSLEIVCWANLDPKLGYFHGPEVRFDNARFIDERLAKRLLNTMKRVNAAIRKADAREEGDVLMAVAKALGLEWFAMPVGPSRGSFYSDHQWEFRSVIEGREYFRALTSKLKAMVPKKEDDAA